MKEKKRRKVRHLTLKRRFNSFSYYRLLKRWLLLRYLSEIKNRSRCDSNIFIAFNLEFDLTIRNKRQWKIQEQDF